MNKIKILVILLVINLHASEDFSYLFNKLQSNTLSNFNSFDIQNDNISLKKGWNKLNNIYKTINIKNTFKNNSIILVSLKDNISNKWATYPYITNDKNILNLKSIEEGIEFYVYTIKDINIQLYTNNISKICQDLIDDKQQYNTLYNSGIDKKPTISEDNSIALNSNYYSNNLKKTYDDTGLILIYPKIKEISKIKNKYGPAEPKMQVTYSKEYENKYFYVYDFLRNSCYKGIFPSRRIPPFQVLKKLK